MEKWRVEFLFKSLSVDMNAGQLLDAQSSSQELAPNCTRLPEFPEMGLYRCLKMQAGLKRIKANWKLIILNIILARQDSSLNLRFLFKAPSIMFLSWT